MGAVFALSPHLTPYLFNYLVLYQFIKMEKEERRKIYEQTLQQWGVENQLWMVCEECGELLNAIGKMRRGRVSREEVITELADVTIMCEQIAQYVGYDDYEKEVERKLNRVIERLKKYK